MLARRFRNERFLVVWERFWDRVLRIRIELRVQKVFGNVVHFGGPAPVLGSCFEHSYSITCSQGGSEMNAFWWSGSGFGIGFLGFV